MNEAPEKFPAPNAPQEPPPDRLAEKRPFVTLPAPIGGATSSTMKWLEDLAANYDRMPEDIKDALILTQRAFPAGEGGVYYLTAAQAMMVVRYCRETQIAVHADHWWFDPRNYRMGSTVSGQREEARRKGIHYAPPVFKNVTQPWPIGVARFVGYETCNDFGVQCTIHTERGDAVQTAWFSLCAQGSKPDAKGLRTVRGGPWSADPMNMLTIRAEGRCLERVTGGSGPDADWSDDTTTKETK